MLIYAALGAIVAVALVAAFVWVMVQDAQASAVSDRWRDAHWRERRDE